MIHKKGEEPLGGRILHKKNPSNDLKMFVTHGGLKMSHFIVQVTCFVSEALSLHGAENSYFRKLILVLSKKNIC